MHLHYLLSYDAFILTVLPVYLVIKGTIPNPVETEYMSYGHEHVFSGTICRFDPSILLFAVWLMISCPLDDKTAHFPFVPQFIYYDEKLDVFGGLKLR